MYTYIIYTCMPQYTHMHTHKCSHVFTCTDVQIHHLHTHTLHTHTHGYESIGWFLWKEIGEVREIGLRLAGVNHFSELNYRQHESGRAGPENEADCLMQQLTLFRAINNSYSEG